MARAAALKRTSVFLDPVVVGRARRVLGAKSDAEAIRLSVERTAEMEKFWRFMERSRRTVAKGSFDAS